MKVNTGFFHLVIVMVFMIASMPMILLLINQCNLSEFSYMDDKTTYSLGSSIGYKEVTNADGSTSFIPENLSCLSMDYGGAIAIAHVNDDYCPSTGSIVKYAYTSGHVLDNVNVGEEGTLRIVDSWDANVNAEYSGLLSKVATSALKEEYSDDKLYLVWNSRHDCWVVTSKFLNIYEYSSDTLYARKNASGNYVYTWKDVNK